MHRSSRTGSSSPLQRQQALSLGDDDGLCRCRKKWNINKLIDRAEETAPSSFYRSIIEPSATVIDSSMRCKQPSSQFITRYIDLYLHRFCVHLVLC